MGLSDFYGPSIYFGGAAGDLGALPYEPAGTPSLRGTVVRHRLDRTRPGQVLDGARLALPLLDRGAKILDIMGKGSPTVSVAGNHFPHRGFGRGAALTASGIDAQVNLSLTPFLDAPPRMTLACWVFIESIDEDAILLHLGDPNDSGSSFGEMRIGLVSGSAYLMFRALDLFAGIDNTVVADPALDSEVRKPIHVAFVVTDTGYEFYLNGVKQSKSVILGSDDGRWVDTMTFFVPEAYCLLPGIASGSNIAYSDFFVWARALNDDEIRNLYVDPDSAYARWDEPLVIDRYRLVPSGIASAEQFGTATIPPSTPTLLPTGIPTAEAFGTATLQQRIAVSGIPTAEAFGTATLQQRIAVSGIPTAEAFGTPSLQQRITVSGIPTAEAFGTATLQQRITVSGIPTAELFGTPAVATVTVITVSGIPTAETFGTPNLQQRIAVSGIPTAELFGTPAVANEQTLLPTGIPTAEAFGTATLQQRIIVTGIPTAEAFGTARLQNVVSPTGVSSAELFGTPALSVTAVLRPVAIPSDEAFGQPRLQLVLQPSGVPSAEAFGAPTLQLVLAPSGVPSAEVFGAPSLQLRIFPSGIASAELFGTPFLGNNNAGPIPNVDVLLATANGDVLLGQASLDIQLALGNVNVTMAAADLAILLKQAGLDISLVNPNLDIGLNG